MASKTNKVSAPKLTAAQREHALPAVQARAAAIYSSAKSRPGTPSGWDGQTPISHYGIDGRLLPEVVAFRAALAATGGK
jgi:hypothetical protein